MNDFLFNNRLFLILLSGHLIGDFVFQTDLIYALKCRDWKGVMLHSGIVSFLSAILVFSAFRNLYVSLIVLLISLITHFPIDLLKLRLRTRNPVYFILDQAVHIASAVFIAVILNPHIHQPMPLQKYFFFTSFAVIATVFMKYLNLAIYRAFKVNTQETRIYEAGAFFERSVIFFFAYMHSFYFLLIPLIIIPRMLYSIKVRREYILYDVASSMIVSSFMGIMLRKVTLNEPFSAPVFIVLLTAFILMNVLTSLSDVIWAKRRTIDL